MVDAHSGGPGISSSLARQAGGLSLSPCQTASLLADPGGSDLGAEARPGSHHGLAFPPRASLPHQDVEMAARLKGLLLPEPHKPATELENVFFPCIFIQSF